MKWVAVVLVLLLLPTYGAQASNRELLGTIPSVVDGKTKSASFELSLPSSVIFKSDTKIDWYGYASFTNEVGDNYVRRTGWNTDDPVTIRVISSGRKATYTVASELAVKVSFTFSAQFDQQSYSLVKEIDFQVGSGSDFTRVNLPRLVRGFNIEIDNPNPGLDEQIVLRARANWDEDEVSSFSRTNFQWLTFNGNFVESFIGDSNRSGEWRQILISGEQYARTGFVLGAFYTVADSGILQPVSQFVFSRKIPVEIAFKAKPRNVKEFSWTFTDGKPGQVSRYDFPERGNKAGNIKMEATINWAAIARNIDCVEARWTLQYQVGNKWIIDGEEYSGVNYGRVCRGKKATEFTGQFIVSNSNEQGNWLKGIRSYRIWSEYQQKVVANFKVAYSPDPYTSSLKVSFPDIVQYGKTYTVTATVTPKYNGTCMFYTYYQGDISVGRAKLINGKASLTFRILWPRSVNASSQTKSISAKCSGGKYSSSGGKLFLGTGD